MFAGKSDLQGVFGNSQNLFEQRDDANVPSWVVIVLRAAEAAACAAEVKNTFLHFDTEERSPSSHRSRSAGPTRFAEACYGWAAF